MESFGSSLRRLRENANKTLKELAAVMNVSVVYVSDIERGRRNPPQGEKLKQIAQFFGIDVNELEDLANKERKRVELNLDSRTETVSDAALVLARRWDTITDEEASKILKIFNKDNKYE